MIQDPANPQIMRLTQLTTDPLHNNVSYAQEAYTAGTTALTANASSATSFQVNVNSSTNPANSIDFGDEATFNNSDLLIYEGPTASNPAIGGLTPGTTYYAFVPDPTNPGVIQLMTSTGAIQTISLSSGTATTVNFLTALAASGLTGGAIGGALVGNPPLVGSFPVTINSTANTSTSVRAPAPALSHASRWSTTGPPHRTRASPASPSAAFTTSPSPTRRTPTSFS